MIRRFISFILDIIARFMEWMISSKNIESSIQDVEFQELVHELIRMLDFDLSFPESVLEEQERIWISFTRNDRISTEVKKDIVIFIKQEYDLIGRWEREEKIDGVFQYELVIELFSPDELQKIQNKKILNAPKYNLEFIVLPPDAEEIEEHPPTPTPKKEKPGWNSEWYKSKKEFKPRTEFLKNSNENNGWIKVQNKKKN